MVLEQLKQVGVKLRCTQKKDNPSIVGTANNKLLLFCHNTVILGERLRVLYITIIGHCYSQM